MIDTRIAMVQMTSRVDNVEGNLTRMDAFLSRAAESEVDIVCFPELNVSGYNAGDTSAPAPEPIPGPCTDRLEEMGSRHGITFLAGLLELGANGVVYNSQIVVGPAGMQGIYRKTHVPTSEIGTWSQGSDLPVFDHPKIRFGVEICYDSHFPEVSTALAENGAELILMPHASGGEESADDKKSRWMRYIPARAYDNTVFTAVCNQVGDNGVNREFVGVTFVCDPRGAVIGESMSGDGEEMVICDLIAEDLREARSVPESFFRHFRRDEMYERWRR